MPLQTVVFLLLMRILVFSQTLVAKFQQVPESYIQVVDTSVDSFNCCMNAHNGWIESFFKIEL